MKKLILIFSALSYLFSQSPAEIYQEASTLYRSAYKDAENEAYATAITKMNSFLNLRPNHQGGLLFLSRLEAMNKNAIAARLYLEQLANLGLTAPIERYEEFTVLPKKDREKLEFQFMENSARVGTSERAFSLKEKGLITEAVAYSSLQDTYYISSVRKRKILAVKNGAVQEFSNEADGLWAVSSLKVSEDGHFLWASSSAIEEMEHSQGETFGAAGLFKYEITTGKLVSKQILNDEHAHLFGDFTIAKNGDIYVSDSKHNAIYLLKHGENHFQTLIDTGYFMSLQGLALNADESQLYLADYTSGLFTLDIKSKKISALEPVKQQALQGIDGIYLDKNDLVAVQNGVFPNRILRLKLNENSIKHVDILEANHPDIDDPTLGTIVNGTFYFVANSQWNAIGRDGKLKPLNDLKEPVILKVRL